MLCVWCFGEIGCGLCTCSKGCFGGVLASGVKAVQSTVLGDVLTEEPHLELDEANDEISISVRHVHIHQLRASELGGSMAPTGIGEFQVGLRDCEGVVIGP